ncbi:MAG: hypothetical protein JWP08_3232, partial [Bryobacterales bacterium]|nr:hypothetical protein [Bryobacterales bacterium]
VGSPKTRGPELVEAVGPALVRQAREEPGSTTGHRRRIRRPLPLVTPMIFEG